MRVQRGLFLGLGVAAACALLTAPATAALVATEDFDGGSVGLISGFNPAVDNLDGGPGDFFGVGNRGAWPQGYPPGMPHSLADDSVVSVSNPADPVFVTDNEATFGQARSLTDNFFAISDTAGIGLPGGPPYTASWTFDVSGFSDLELCLDLGAHANDSFGGFSPNTLVIFTYSIDGGPVDTALSIAPNSSFGGFTYRAMDSTLIPAVGTNGPLQATGANPITKTLVDSGLIAADTFLDKSPAAGTGAGLLDTFATDLNGSGSQLTLTLSADLPFEAMAFDNITIKGVPEPGSIVLVGLGAIGLVAGHRAGRRRS
ncbi:MAG: PEP-CTERM sorting domain-containing protein [Pirellulales bacterium]